MYVFWTIVSSNALSALLSLHKLISQLIWFITRARAGVQFIIFKLQVSSLSAYHRSPVHPSSAPPLLISTWNEIELHAEDAQETTRVIASPNLAAVRDSSDCSRYRSLYTSQH